MVTRDEILGSLPAYQGKKVLILGNQSADDIINEITLAHKKYASHYDKIAAKFWKGNLTDTGKYIFDFLKKNVNYSIEPDRSQSVKSPASIIATGIYKNGYNDCKHYSLFISGVLDALRRQGKKINWKYRFANYRWFTDEPQHVFIVADDGKNEIWIDPVLKTFNERKGYINKIDKKNPMALYSISGTDTLQPIAGAGIGKRKPGKKRGGFFKKLGKGLKNKFNIIKKISLAPSRASFMLILKINPFKMANNLNAALDNPMKRGKLLGKWKKLGGNPKTFEKAVRKQYAHWKKRKGIKGIGYINVQGVGVIHYTTARRLYNQQCQRKQVNRYRRQKGLAPLRPLRVDNIRFNQQTISGAEIGAIQLAALLAAAVPVITLLAEFLPKKMKKTAENAAQNIPIEQQQAAVQSASAQDPGARAEMRETGGGSYRSGSDEPQEQETGGQDNEDRGGGSGKGITMNTNTTLLLAAGVGAALLLTRKK